MENEFSCPVYKKCGGCQLDVSYKQQLSYKNRLVVQQLGRFCKPESIVGMENPFHYRCKVSSAFGYSNGRIVTGVWQSSGGRLVRVDDCALEDERAAPIVQTICELMETFRLRTYDARTGRGLMRFVTLRIGRHSGEILVYLGTGACDFPCCRDFIRELVRRRPEITTVVRTVSTSHLNLMPGRDETVLYGPGFIMDSLCGRNFRISARSFFQVNPAQTEKLYSAAIEFASLSGTERVIDAYCGVGTIGIIAADKAKQVIAVEQNSDAVNNAKTNAALNDIKNISFFKADAGAFMIDMARSGDSVDVVFTDPPRAGCSREFLQALAVLKPEKIVYISCNPETQARDLQYLTKKGYRAARLRPVDMFPYTRHIETVCLLVRAQQKTH